VTEWRELSTRLHALGTTFTTMGVQDAAAACQDAALAMLQGRSVLSARATWRAGDAIESTVAGAKDPKRARNAVDDIFADSGFSGRQTVETVTDDKGKVSEQINDWCGMFVAAGMFRGAGLDKDMRKAFAHTDNVYDFFRYKAEVNRRAHAVVDLGRRPLVARQRVPPAARARCARGWRGATSTPSGSVPATSCSSATRGPSPRRRSRTTSSWSSPSTPPAAGW
jgi:hypothetical protein